MRDNDTDNLIPYNFFIAYLNEPGIVISILGSTTVALGGVLPIKVKTVKVVLAKESNKCIAVDDERLGDYN